MKKYLTLIVFVALVVFTKLSTFGQDSVSLVYLYGNESFLALKQRDLSAINTVAPSYFDIDEQGNLMVNLIDKVLVKELHTKQIKITPFFSNHWDRERGRLALKNSSLLIPSLVNVIEQYDFDGINIDIENLNEEDRENYVSFVKALRQALPKEKTISVAVAANPRGIHTGWQGSYDYSQLAKYADYLVLMAYDEHYEGGEEGAVSSISFFEKSIQYALKQMDGNKLIVGVPFYGRYWKENELNGGYGVTTQKIAELKQKYFFDEKYDEQTKSMIASIKIENEWINGKKLSLGNYTFYYENKESMLAKIAMVKKYHLGGIAAWSLGQETKEIWTAFCSYLSKMTSLNGEEAEWADEAIEFVKKKGWMQGRSVDQFMPNEKITRAEFVTVIARYLSLELPFDEEDSYADIQNHWAKKSIIAVSKTGIINGYGDSLFKPDQFITREEIAKILDTLIIPKKSQSDIFYCDVEKSSWAYSAIQNMSKNGILKGYEDGTFCPKQEITRAEVAVIMQRMDQNR